MKMYLFLAILVYKCSDHFSCAEYELADGVQAENDPANSQLDYSNGPDSGDYANGNNGLVFEFRRSIKSDNTEIEARRRSALDKNFMRFGRADRGFLRFGRLPESVGDTVDDDGVPYSLVHYTALNDQLNDPKDRVQAPVASVTDTDDDGDDEDSSSSFSFAKRTPISAEETEISDSGEQIKPKPYVYYRRDAPKNLMRFGKRQPQQAAANFLRMDRANLMRFGRAGAGSAPRGNLLRFGRDNGNLMRFGRASGNLMRFGRASGNLMRFGRSDPRFVRLVKMDNNFMRFGRSDKSLKPDSNVNGTTDPAANYK